MKHLMNHTDSAHVIGFVQCRGMGKSRALDEIPSRIHKILSARLEETGSLNDQEQIVFDSTRRLLKINFTNGNGSPKRQELSLGVEVSLCLRLLHAGYIEQARRPGDVHHFTMVLREILRYQAEFDITFTGALRHFTDVAKPMVLCDEVQIYGMENSAEVMGCLCDTIAASAFLICSGTNMEGFRDSCMEGYLTTRADNVFLSPLSMKDTRKMVRKTLEKSHFHGRASVYKLLILCGGVPRIIASVVAAVQDRSAHIDFVQTDETIDLVTAAIIEGKGSWEASRAAHFCLGLRKRLYSDWGNMALRAACSRLEALTEELLPHVGDTIVLLRSETPHRACSAFVPLIVVEKALEDMKGTFVDLLKRLVSLRSLVFPPLGDAKEKPVAFLSFMAAHFGAVIHAMEGKEVRLDCLLLTDDVFQELTVKGTSISLKDTQCITFLDEHGAPEVLPIGPHDLLLHRPECRDSCCSAADWAVSLCVSQRGKEETTRIVIAAMAFFETDARVTAEMADSVFGENGTGRVGDVQVILLIESVWPLRIEEDCFQEGRRIVVKQGKNFFDFLGPFFKQFTFHFNLNCMKKSDLATLLGSPESAAEVQSMRRFRSLRRLQNKAYYSILKPLDDIDLLSF